jgi:hypothetical protein
MGMTYLAITTLPASFKFARNGVYVVAAKKSTSQMDVDEDNQANEAEVSMISILMHIAPMFTFPIVPGRSTASSYSFCRKSS